MCQKYSCNIWESGSKHNPEVLEMFSLKLQREDNPRYGRIVKFDKNILQTLMQHSAMVIIEEQAKTLNLVIHQFIDTYTRIGRVIFVFKKMLFHQDNPRPHTARMKFQEQELFEWETMLKPSITGHCPI